MSRPPASRLRSAGLALGPALFLAVLLSPSPVGMGAAAHRVAALTVWMGVWWLSAAVALEVTSLLPLALLPLLGVGGIEQAAGPYANSVIFLFLGGFFLAAAMERWHLHKRIAYAILGAVGTEARRVVLAFMLATAFLSMWISNTAAAVMMLPMAMAVLKLARSDGDAAGRPGAHPADGLGTALALGIAYAASLGGIATLIGTPPNAIYAAAAKQLYGEDVGFGRWMAVGLPLGLVLLPACWLMLTRWLFKAAG
ncbi:MAG: anion permease, partial [Gemmatimonadetes bacterium]|nr:anion permease [Gemmatimonadota bacterium]